MARMHVPMRPTLPDRRGALAAGLRLAGLLAGLGLLPPAAQAAYNSAAFDADNLAALARVLGIATPVESREVTLQGPEMAENGASVNVSFGTSLPGVRRLLLLVDKNPHPVCAIFELGDGLDAAFTTRVKMSQTAQVQAVAVLADGRVLFAQREIKVTLGGCAG
jgi:sulfur-oxidizing protein SoxY